MRGKYPRLRERRNSSVLERARGEVNFLYSERALPAGLLVGLSEKYFLSQRESRISLALERAKRKVNFKR